MTPSTTARLPIDPRIRQRRVEVLRRQGRRRLRVLLTTTGVVLLAVGAGFTLHSPVFDVDHVSIVGARRSPLPAIRAAAGIETGDLLIHVDPGAAARAIARLPWVATARVERDWRGTVRIRVGERMPAAAIRAERGWAVVDAGGRVLDVVGEVPTGLPPVEGGPPAGRPGSDVDAAVRPVLAVATLMPAPLIELAPTISRLPSGEVELRFAAGGTVRLGTPDRLATKMAAAVAVLAHLETPPVVLDVRVPSVPAVTRSVDTPEANR